MLRLSEISVAVLKGGTSGEREVSLRSSENIEAGLSALGFSFVSYDTADLSYIDKLRAHRPDLVFLALHGKGGEDGTVQGLLETLSIPYTGSGILASALAWDKFESKKVFESHGLRTPRGIKVKRTEILGFDAGKLTELYQDLSMRFGTTELVVKPNSEGSSLGVSLINSAEELPEALALAAKDDDYLLIEECISGREVTVGILEDKDGKPFALPLIEIVPKTDFYNYENKYTAGATDFVVPAKLDEALADACQEMATRAHRALGCAGYSRSDIRLNKQGEPYILETNTLPGLTSGSLIPHAASVAGIDREALLAGIMQSSLQR
jgi:D-alanine-D-alanine ligase